MKTRVPLLLSVFFVLLTIMLVVNLAAAQQSAPGAGPTTPPSAAPAAAQAATGAAPKPDVPGAAPVTGDPAPKSGTEDARPDAGAATGEAPPADASRPTPPTAPKRDANTYIIGEQDVLNITVWKEPELSGPVVVRPDGKITLPLVNDVYVIGMTTDDLQQALTDKLKPFVNVPQVTVTPREINSRKVYLIGQVAHEGTFRINSSTTVLQLIAEAGGLRDFAKRKKIYVMRNENGRQSRFPFNYDEAIQGKNMKQNILLQPGDTIVIP